jgi:GDP-L-fucose synthase
MKIYVAGHTGMLGSAIVRALKRHDYDWIAGAKVDLTNTRDTYDVFDQARPDYVFMASGAVGGIQANIDNPARFLGDNARMAMNVIDACKEYGAKLCYVGSSCIYPRECPQPMKEEYLLTGKLESTNEAYSLAKIVGLKYAQYVLGDNHVAPMPPNLYGVNDNYGEGGHVLASLVRRFVDAVDSDSVVVTLWGEGLAKREFLNVDDAANGLIFLMENNVTGMINMGSGEDFSIQQLAALIAKSTGYKGEIEWDTSKPSGMPRKLLDSGRINAMGWKPEIGMFIGIQQMIAQYRQLKISRQGQQS